MKIYFSIISFWTIYYFAKDNILLIDLNPSLILINGLLDSINFSASIIFHLNFLIRYVHVIDTDRDIPFEQWLKYLIKF